MNPPSPKDRKEAIDSFLELAKHWNDQMALHRRSFAEDYCRGALSLIYELEIAASLVGEDESAATGEQSGLDPKSRACVVFHPKTANPHCLKLGNQEPVLVVDVEVVETIKNVAILSLAGLYDVQDDVSEDGDGLLVFSLFEKRFKFLHCGIDREIDLVPFGTIVGGKLVPDMVESTSEVVEGIPEDGSKWIWNGLSRDDLHKLLQSFRVTVGGDCASTRLEECSSASIEILDVCMGPFEF